MGLEELHITSKNRYSVSYLTNACFLGFVALPMALILSFIKVVLAVIPLSIFVLLCFLAPFIQRLNFYLPIIRRGGSNNPLVAITFDDGPDPYTTPLLLDILSKYSVKAAFFIIGERAKKHPELVREILARGHEVGNHSNTHDNLLMLKSSKALSDDIVDCQIVLKQFGIKPMAFRPPVGITNPKLFRVLIDLNMFCIGFSRRALDFGNRRVAGMANRILRHIRTGDILLLHDCRPGPVMDVKIWLKEVENILIGIAGKGLIVESLSKVIKKPIMEQLMTRDDGEPNKTRLHVKQVKGANTH